MPANLDKDLAAEMTDLHMLMQLLQIVDMGLILVDRDYTVQLWNNFVENYSGIRTSTARGGNLFLLFPELPKLWMKQKIDSVFRLRSRANSTWEQHPRLFNFKSSHPLTGKSELMYQNITMIPLTGLTGEVTRVCILINDVTDIATYKLELAAMNETFAAGHESGR